MALRLSALSQLRPGSGDSGHSVAGQVCLLLGQSPGPWPAPQGPWHWRPTMFAPGGGGTFGHGHGAALCQASELPPFEVSICCPQWPRTGTTPVGVGPPGRVQVPAQLKFEAAVPARALRLPACYVGARGSRRNAARTWLNGIPASLLWPPLIIVRLPMRSCR